MKDKLKLYILLLAILSASALARAQGTAFTYQGRLNENGSLANGDYDLNFSIFDDAVAGNQVGASSTKAPTSVSNGLFTVTLDFGASVFTGEPRWVEIGVTHSGSGEDFVTLSPRQALTASPYAIFAGTAANVASGSVVTGLNGLKDEVTLEAGANVTLTPNGNTLTIASTLGNGSDVWSVLNNNAYYNAGNVGIGTTLPATALEVNGMVRSTRSGNAAQYIQLHGGDSGSIKLTAKSSVAAEKTLYLENLSGEATPGANNQIQFVLGTPAAPSTKMTITRDGNVGIGTPSPQAKLEVNGDVRVNSGSGIALDAADGPMITRGWDPFNSDAPLNRGGHGRWGLFMEPGRLVCGIPDLAGRAFDVAKYTPEGGAAVLLRVDQNGNVGIGTISPQEKLHVAGNILATGTITGSSDRNVKRDFAPVNSSEVLDRVATLPISTWSYIADDGVRHLGPMAQDFYSAFNVGMDDKHISMVDADGVALAAIQGLNQKLNEKVAEIRELNARLERLENLMNQKNGGAK